MEIVIRRATHLDEEASLTIRYKAWLKAYNHIFGEDNINKFFLNRFADTAYRQESAKRIDENPNYYMACDGDTPVAVLIMNLDKENMHNNEVVCFYCHPDYQRNGIGQKLFDFAKNVFKENNINYFVVEALKENFIGNNFYTKHGGKIFKEFKKEICYTTADMVVFEFKI